MEKKPEKRVVWSQCWLDYSYLRSQQASHAAFARLLMTDEDFEPPRIVRDWRAGRHSAHPDSVLAVDKKLPERTSWLFFLPMVRLLTPRKWTVPYLRGLLAPYCVKNAHGELTWRFPNDAQLREQGRLTYFRSWDDTTRLMERGDICGFMAILGLVRLAEAQRDMDRHYTFSKDLYRALPAIAREPWIQPRIDDLLELIEAVMRRMVWSVLAYRVKWNVIREQILSATYEPNPLRRTVDPTTGRVAIPEDPIFEMPTSACYLPAYKRPFPLLTGPLEEEEGAPPQRKLNLDFIDPQSWFWRRRRRTAQTSS